MKKFVSFTKIGQFRQIVRDVRHVSQFQGMDDNGDMIMNRTADMPTISFKGTVKLHGTNAGVGSDGVDQWAQSRKGIITTQRDNAGFAFFTESNKDVFESFLSDVRKKEQLTTESVIIFGEWCGGNIQKGVAINGLDKMFVIFGVKIATLDEEESNYYLTEDKWCEYRSIDNRIYNINDYQSYIVDIDFNIPDLARNKTIEIMQQIEKECPVGKAFGRKLGEDNTTGGGVVFVGWDNGNRYIFKVKGEEHSSSKVKTLAPVDIEKLNSINEFVEYAVTENRLNQAIEQVFTSESKKVDVKHTGDFLRWIVNDITVEESDTLIENGLEPKEVNRTISITARKWYMKYIDTINDL